MRATATSSRCRAYARARTTSHLEVESYDRRDLATTETHTPVGVDGCNEVPFSPSVTVTPETAQSDAADGASTVVQVPQNVNANEINTSDIHDAHVTLPEGLTLNPSAAHGLAACTAAQIGIGTTNAVGCPPGSKVGTVDDRNGPPAGLAHRQRLPRSPRRRPDHRPPVHDLPGRRECEPTASRSACRARSRPTRARAGWKSRSRTTPSFRSANCA